MLLGQYFTRLFSRLSGGRKAADAMASVKPSAPGAPYRRGDILGEYEMQGVLGVGGFSVVYLAYARKTGNYFALKTLRDEFLSDNMTRQQFRREAKMWVDLGRHPNIVRADFIAELDQRLYIGMEYVQPNEQGINTLEGYLTTEHPDLEQSLRWAVQFCHGMEFARSRGIRCHRDVKPANIMITRDRVVKITDFGFADVIDTTRTAAALALSHWRRRAGAERAGFGTPTHMPPEQFQNATRCDERSDIYSFGVVLFQMAARGRLPFAAQMRRKSLAGDQVKMWNNMHQLHTEAPVPRLASPLFPIIRRCMEKEPSKRYQTFGDLRHDLELMLKRKTGKVVEAVGTPGAPEAWELYNRAYSLSSLGNLEEAIVCYDKALRLQPRNADAWNNKGVCLVKLHRVEEAIRCYERAIAINPQNASAWRNRGHGHFALGRYSQALADLQRATELDPGNAQAWLNRGLAEERLGRGQAALESFRRYVALSPTDRSPNVAYARKRIAEANRR